MKDRNLEVIDLKLFDSTIQSLEQGLNFSTKKGEAISQNIANVDTPRYKAKTVNFKEMLEEAKVQQLEAHRTEDKHLPFRASNRSSGVSTLLALRYRHNGNGVDMDREQADLAANQIYYNALVDRLNGKFNTLQQVVKGGR